MATTRYRYVVRALDAFSDRLRKMAAVGVRVACRCDEFADRLEGRDD